MQFTKFVIVAGQITSRLDLDASGFELPLLLKAGEILTRLRILNTETTSTERPLFAKAMDVFTGSREKAVESTIPLPSSPDFVIRLGSGGLSFEEMDRMQRAHAATHPPRITRESWEEVQRRSLMNYFNIKNDDQPGRQQTCVIFAESAEDGLKSGLHGAIAGSYFRSQHVLPEAERDKTPVETVQAFAPGMEEEIWAARPCLVCFGNSSASVSSFIDCFAAAMLLNPETLPS